MANSNLLGLRVKQNTTIRFNKSRNENEKLLINFLICLAIPFFIVFVLELLTRGFAGTREFMKMYPKVVLLNYALLVVALSPAIFAKRSQFVALILSIPWVVASLASFVLSKVRGVPFIWSDLYSAGDGMSIASLYMTKPIIFKIGICVAFGVGLIILASKFKFKPYAIHPIKRGIAFVILVAIGFLGKGYLESHNAVQIIEWDTMQSYNRNGFAYSFVHSYLSTFRKAPEGYSKEAIDDIMKGMSNTTYAVKDEMPNVIMVQLEGVFDPTTLSGVNFSQDPMPNIRKYMKENYSGRIQVPTIGGGTARTEFEALAGINMDYLSPGEIPYNSGMINKGPVETLAYTFKDKGYVTTGIHNFEGNFYSRHIAYKNLGFDTFVSMETMNNVDRSDNYPKDAVLVDYIKKAIEKTDDKDFIFTVGVETHGPYDYEYDAKKSNSPVKVNSSAYEKKAVDQLQNYVDRLRGTDAFVGALADYVDNLTEETILVIYSDHYPALDVLKDVSNEETHLTPYFIMSNMNNIIKRQNYDIEAYQLGTELMELIDMKGGIMNTFHTTYREDVSYQTKLQLLQYDMLFGKKYSTNKESIYEPTIIQIGLDKLQIDEVHYEEGHIVIKGSGFTDSSRIFIKDKLIETKFISENELIGTVEKAENKPVTVKQLGRNDKAIVSSEAYRSNY